MKHTWLIGAVVSVTLVGSVVARADAQTPQSKPTAPTPTDPAKQKPTTPATTPQTEKQTPPASEKPAAPRRATGQRATAEVPTGETALGSVSIPRPVTADGKPLARGTYSVRLTAQSAQPTVPGQLPDLNRWVEFVQGGQVRGREVVSIIPADEEDDTQQGPDLTTGRPRVPRGSSRVEALKGGEYIRVWINRGGHHYLVHLVPQGGAAR